MKRFITAALFALCLLQAPYALAYSVSFGDDAKVWDGYQNSDYDWNGHGWVPQNNRDVIGTPDLSGGNFIWEGHTLTGIELSYSSTDSNLTPGDWFFDFDQDNSWDYVLHNNVGLKAETKWVGYWFWKHEVETGGTVTEGPNAYGLYGVDLPYGTDEFGNAIMDGYVESFWPDGQEGRHDHPVMADLSDDPDHPVTVSEWIKDTSGMPGTTTWSGIDLDLLAYEGDTFTYAFAMTCANDVLFGKAMVPSPEPSSFLLLGFGGLGLLLYGRKRKRAL